MNAILSILVIAGLLFGGGATVNAAQDDLPNEPLYMVKTWTEDFSLKFQDNQEERVARLMDLAQIRIQEMTRLAEIGEPIPDQVRLRLEQHIQQALQTCANMDDPALERTLLQIRDRLQTQDRDMEQLQFHTQDPLLTQTRTMLQQHLRLVEDGLLNHEIFRNQVQNGFQYGQDDDLTPPVQDGNGQQYGQPTLTPVAPNTDPGGPNTAPGGSNTESDGNTNGSDSGSGGNGSGGSGSNDNGSGGGGKP